MVAVALGKKTGGCRLIGLATAVYGIWARVRYLDCRLALEAGLKRPCFAAAPGVGAAKAAFEAAFVGEAAAARGLDSACTLVDLRQFYEHIEVMEFATGARSLGLPLKIVTLTAHLYLGPRCIRVSKAHSKPVFPIRSILPGCTWATVHIRFMMLSPADSFCSSLRARLQRWEVGFRFSVFVDDMILALSGTRWAVASCHVWASRLLLQWLTRVLQKPIAVQKLQCVASSASLKKLLGPGMSTLAIPVSLVGEVLGIDHSAGGKLRRRPVQHKRLHSAWKRRLRISWWHKLGGNAVNVARAVRPSVEYGADAIGLPDRALDLLRLVYGAAVGIICGGSSLTVRLAIGEEKYEDIDPATLDANPPLMALAAAMWDDPTIRAVHARTWFAVKADAKKYGKKWQWVRGPIGAAWMSLARIGATWPSPFVVRLLEVDVNLLEVPPLQVKAILQAHARWHLDVQLMERLVFAHPSWDAEAVRAQYKSGIDWPLLRQVLQGNVGELQPSEKMALRVVACGGFWPAERKWLAGFVGHGTCEACFEAIGGV